MSLCHRCIIGKKRVKGLRISFFQVLGIEYLRGLSAENTTPVEGLLRCGKNPRLTIAVKYLQSICRRQYGDKGTHLVHPLEHLLYQLLGYERADTVMDRHQSSVRNLGKSILDRMKPCDSSGDKGLRIMEIMGLAVVFPRLEMLLRKNAAMR